jgi:hypothetical protein
MRETYRAPRATTRNAITETAAGAIRFTIEITIRFYIQLGLGYGV